MRACADGVELAAAAAAYSCVASLGAAQRRTAGAILTQRSIAALWRVARARGGRGWLLVGLEDAGTRGGVTRRVTKCDVLELKRPRGKTLVQSAVPKRSKPLSANSAFALV